MFADTPMPHENPLLGEMAPSGHLHTLRQQAEASRRKRARGFTEEVAPRPAG